MAILKTREIREMNEAELATKLTELKEELARQRGQIASGTRPDNPGRMKVVRKTIARILTIQHVRESASKKEISEVSRKK